MEWKVPTVHVLQVAWLAKRKIVVDSTDRGSTAATREYLFPGGEVPQGGMTKRHYRSTLTPQYLRSTEYLLLLHAFE